MHIPATALLSGALQGRFDFLQSAVLRHGAFPLPVNDGEAAVLRACFHARSAWHQSWLSQRAGAGVTLTRDALGWTLSIGTSPVAFTVTRSGWTDVGSPTVTGRYQVAGNICLFEVKVVPATTVATTAGTSYVALPVTAAGIAGMATMMDITTLIAIGDCAVDVTNSRVYVPTQLATGDTLTIAGAYEV